MEIYILKLYLYIFYIIIIIEFIIFLFFYLNMYSANNFEFLPNSDENKLQLIFSKFDTPINNISDIKKVFFNNKCYFFTKIEQKYQKEGEDFIKIFAHLKKLVFDINNLFPKKGIETLKTCDNKFIELNRKQVALIFLLSFFDLIDVKSTDNKNYFIVSNILFTKYENTFQFGRCFLNYLTVIGRWLAENNPILEEKIVFGRKNEKSKDYLEKSDVELCKLKLIDTKESLFNGDASYGIDFANQYIGGGTLNGGCVQEEILFAIEPEAIVSLFFMEVMDDNDAIAIFNTIQYSKYDGYGWDFIYTGCAIDDKNIKKNRIIAIDAICVGSYGSYFVIKNEINRDIHKAYVGFSLAKSDNNIPKTIATGNWGCGAFNGNHELKFIQQWIAASYAGIERLDYYTFKDKNMILVEKYYEKIKNKFKTAKELYDALISVSTSNKGYIEGLLNIKL